MLEIEILRNFTSLADFCRQPEITFEERKLSVHTRDVGVISVRNCDRGIEHFRMVSNFVKDFKVWSSVVLL